LQRIVGVVHRAEHAIAVRMQLDSVPFDQFGEVGFAVIGKDGQGCSTTIRV
jgi:hypothetical protein